MNIKSLREILELYVEKKYNKNGQNLGNIQDLKASVFLLDPEFRSLLQEQLGAATGSNGANSVDFSSISLGDVLNNFDINENSVIDFSALQGLEEQISTINQEQFDNILMQDNVDIDALNDLLPDGMKITDIIGDTSIDNFKNDYNKQGSDKINDIVNEKKEVDKLLDEAYKNKTVINTLDEDGDEKLSDKEKKKFEDYLRGADGTISEKSLKDTIDDIIDGKFSYETPQTPDTDNNDVTSSETPEVEKAKKSSKSSGSHKSSSGDNNSSGQLNNSNPNTNNNVENQNTNLESMSLDELKQKRNEKQAEADKARDSISKVYSGENDAVKQAKEDAQTKQKEYEETLKNDEKVSNELKDRQAENQQKINDQHNIIDGLNSDINTKEKEISAKASEIASTESQIDAVKEAIASYDSNDTSSEKSKAEARLRELQAQLKTQQEEKDKLESDKADLEAKLSDEQENLQALETERTDIENEILENCGEKTKKAMDDFKTAEANVETVKANELQTAKSALETAQAELEDINSQIRTKEAQETKEQYSSNKYNFDFALTENMTDSQKAELENLKKVFKEHESEYKKVEELTGIPAELVCAIHYRESNNNFKTYLHNGDPLGKTTTHVPKGKYFEDWTSAAVDALTTHYKYKEFNKNSLDSWMDFAESYNGYGMKKKGLASSYVYTGTTKYTGGRYVADGKFDKNSYDKRLGIYVICHGLLA